MIANADPVEIDGIYYNLISKGNIAEVTRNPSVSYYTGSYSGEVVIPESITYEEEVYNVTSIASTAFYNCKSLTSVTIPSSVTSIGNNAFGNCSVLASVIIPNNVTSIGDNAFASCIGLTSVTIGNSVTTIGDGAFGGCIGLTSVTIPNSVTSLSGFSGCSGLTSISIPNSVTSIGSNAFSGCYGLTSITIPATVTSIGNNAFAYCRGLTTVNIPNTVTSMGATVFADCSELTSVTIGSGIAIIWSQTFSGSTKLVDVYCMRKEVPITESDVFKSSHIEYATLHVPESSIDAYKAATPWKDFKSIVKIDFPKHNLTYMVDGVEYKNFEIEEGESITPETEPTREGYTFSGWSEIPATMPTEDVTITGTFSINKYDLIYKVDGVDYKSYNIDYGTSITPEAAPTREGFTFSGWGEVPATMPAHDVTITGSFTKGTYKLTYVVDEQTYKIINYDYEAAITPEPAPTRDHYTFSGWSEIPATMPANDVNVTGSFSINKYNLIYKVDGEDYKTVQVDYGASITPEPAPTRDHYTFSGWSDIPATMPANDVTITGTFSINKYNLIYKVDGEDYKTIPTEYNSTITPEEAPTKTGYTFSGWSEIPATMPANEVTITGTFSINNYNLIYKVDGEDYKTVPTEYNSDITPEAAPTKTGYTFSGWSEIPATMPANDVTITGTFSINKYNLIYKVDGEDYKTVPTEYNSSITPEAAPTKEGHVFSGWSEIPATMPANDVTVTGTFAKGKYKLTYYFDGNVYQASDIEYGTSLTPISDPSVGLYYTFSGWSEIPETMPAHDVDITGTSFPKKYTLKYKVHYSTNLFVYTTYKTLEVDYGATITPEPDAAQEGYTFSGWSSIPATMPGYNLDITGLFTAKNYTLTYKLDGETYKSYTVKYGATITPEAAPTVDGFTFNGWGDLPATMPARDVTVNASMTKKPTSNVNYPAEWDMSGWSQETVTNLNADSKWYKSDLGFYLYQGTCPEGESIELTANNQLIKETAGVEFAVNNCTGFEISDKEGKTASIVVYEPSDFFFVLKNLKRGQKISINFESSDWNTNNDLFPQPVGAEKMTDRAVTRAIRSESSVADYIVSSDGDVRFNVNADKFFYLYNIDVTDVSETNLSFLSNPDGINDQIDCYLYWNGTSSSATGPWGGSYARGADVRIENKSNQTITITKIEMYDGTTNIGTFTDQNGDLAPNEFKEFAVSVSSSVEMPSTLPWMEVFYTKKFVSDGTKPSGSSDSGDSGESGDTGDSSTDINGHKVNGEDGEHEDIYTLDGRKLGSYPTQKGIYIKNGKKFVVK